MPPVTLAMETAMLLLGLESSCDDTAAALVRQMPGQRARVLSSVVVGQTELHASFGGVVPEIAARAHAEKLDLCVEKALAEADLSLADVDGFAVTAGPGLIGGVLSGVMCAKGLSAATGKPLMCLGLNKDGSAKHPLYLRKDTRLRPFPMPVVG